MRCSAFQIVRETAKRVLDRLPLEQVVESRDIAGVLAGRDVTSPDPPVDVMTAARQLRSGVQRAA